MSVREARRGTGGHKPKAFVPSGAGEQFPGPLRNQGRDTGPKEAGMKAYLEEGSLILEAETAEEDTHLATLCAAVRESLDGDPDVVPRTSRG